MWQRAVKRGLIKFAANGRRAHGPVPRHRRSGLEHDSHHHGVERDKTF